MSAPAGVEVEIAFHLLSCFFLKTGSAGGRRRGRGILRRRRCYAGRALEQSQRRPQALVGPR